MPGGSITPTLAIGFANPWLLAGLALAAIPILLHLLGRRTYRETDWAAMTFLRRAARRRSRRVKLERLLLLAIRVGILVLVTLACAQPYLSAERAATGPAPVRHTLILMDTSFSMGVESAGVNRFARARDYARQLLRQARPGDAFQLARLSQRAPRILLPGWSSAADAASELDTMTLTEEPADLLASLEELADVFQGLPGDIQAGVVVLSDLQRRDWKPDSATRQARLTRLLERLTERANVMFVDPGRDVARNTAVTAVDLADEPALIGRPVTIQATIANLSDTPRDNLSVQLRIDDQPVDNRVIALLPDQRAPISFTQVFEQPGRYRVDVRLPEDALLVDNSRRTILTVRPFLNVLLIDGKLAARPRDRAGFYVEQALSPMTQRTDPLSPIRIRTVDDGEWSLEPLEEYDCVFLCGVAELSDADVEQLDRYVRAGGSLLCLPAAQPTTAASPAWDALLPAALGQQAGNPADPQVIFHIAVDRLDHPIVEPFRGNPTAGLGSPLILAYHRARPVPSARVVLALDNGDPLILEHDVDAGRVILVTTPLDGSLWNTLARRDGSVLVALVGQMLDFAVNRSANPRKVLVGQSWTRSLPRTFIDQTISLIPPSGDRVRLAMSPVLTPPQLTVPAVDRSGFYQIVTDVQELDWLAVNVDAAESDLSRIADMKLPGRQIYSAAWNPDTSPAAATGNVADSQLVRSLLYAALLLVLCEVAVAWNLRAGLLLSAAIVGGVLLISATLWQPHYGVGLALSIAAAVVLIVRHELRSREAARNAASRGLNRPLRRSSRIPSDSGTPK